MDVLLVEYETVRVNSCADVVISVVCVDVKVVVIISSVGGIKYAEVD